jgi:putative hemolysin
MAGMIRASVAALLFLASSPGAQALEKTEVVLNGKTVRMISEPEKHVTVSEPCEIGKPKSCEALRALDRASMKALDENQRKSSANPGAMICSKIGGKVVIARDSEQNQNAFCGFADGSWIDCGTLFWFGRNK